VELNTEQAFEARRARSDAPYRTSGGGDFGSWTIGMGRGAVLSLRGLQIKNRLKICDTADCKSIAKLRYFVGRRHRLCFFRQTNEFFTGRMKFTPGSGFILVLFLGTCLTLEARDRWSALSQIESGDRDDVQGRAGEISRYQIKPQVWQRFAPAGSDWKNAKDSLLVAKAVMEERCVTFERSFHRPPTDFEFFILWNAPSQVGHPSKAVARRAGRFCNLVGDGG